MARFSANITINKYNEQIQLFEKSKMSKMSNVVDLTVEVESDMEVSVCMF